MKPRSLLFVLLAACFLSVAPATVAQAPDASAPAAVTPDNPVAVPAPVETPAPVAAPIVAAPVAKAEIKEAPVVPVVPEGETEIEEIGGTVMKTIDNWQQFGWLVGVMMIAYLLVLASKFGPLDRFLKANGIKWLRPVLAAIFGGFGGAVSAFYTGQSVFATILAGVLAGLGSSGFHEFISVVTSKNEREKRS